MDITVTKLLEDNVYKVTIETVGFSQSDLDLLADFDEPKAEVGGQVDDGGTTVYTTLDSLQREIKSGFPYVQKFDADTMGSNALLAANAWATQVTTNITNALTALRALSNSFDGTTTTTV